MNDKIKIVVLAASFLLPAIKDGLANEPGIEIRFAASFTEQVLLYIDRQSAVMPDLLILLDNSIPVAGPEFIRACKERNLPLIAVAASVAEGFKLLEQGAVDMLVRRMDDMDSNTYFYRMLAIHITETAQKYKADRQRASDLPPEPATGKVIAIGSSTGGTETVLKILMQMPADAPPILIVQHMPPVFTKLYAERANTQCAIKVWEARDGDPLANGLALIAPGDYHMTLEKKNGRFQVACKKGERVCSQCPSVDVLFDSVAQVAKKEAVGVILTGMGADGANGLLQMYRQGAYTIGQDEETCVVYGMPKAAFELGAVSIQLPLSKIPQEILNRAGYAR